MKLLSRFVKIKEEEKSKVMNVFYFSFLIGVFQSFIYAISMALFLTTFSSSLLPNIYIFSAMTILVIGLIITSIESHIKYQSLMIGILYLITLVTLSFWTGLLFKHFNWIYFCLLVWGITSYDLCLNPFWSISNRIFSLEQGKRLFGPIGTIQSIGGMCSGLILPVFLKFIDIHNMVLVTAIVAFFISIYAKKVIMDIKLHDDTDADENIETPNNSKMSIIKIPLAWKTCVVSMLGISSLYIIDMLFNTLAEQHYPDQNQLASFLGLFLGVNNLCNIIFSSTLCSKLYTRYGIINSTLLLPVTMIMVSIILCMTNITPWAAGLVFWLVGFLKICEETLRGSLAELSYLLLLNPLIPKLRAFVLTKLDLFATPIATLVISFLLIFISNYFGVSTILFIFMAFCVYLVYTIVLISLRKNYSETLNNSIAKQHYSPLPTLNFSPNDVNLILNRYLESEHPQEVVYALQLYKNQNKATLATAIKKVLNNPNKIVQTYILTCIKDIKLKSFIPNIIKKIKQNGDKEYLVEALECLEQLQQYDFVENQLIDLINHDDLYLKQKAITLSLKSKNLTKKIKVLAQENLNKMVMDPTPLVKKTAASIIGEVQSKEHFALLRTLYHDSNKSVSIQALHAALYSKFEELYPEIVNNISSFSITLDELSLFNHAKDIFAPLLINKYKFASSKEKNCILSLLSHLETTSINLFLEKIAFKGLFTHQLLALTALFNHEAPLTIQFKLSIEKLILDDLNKIKLIIDEIKNVPAHEDTKLFVEILNERILFYLNRVLICLGILYDKNSINKVIHVLKSGNKEDFGNAFELIILICNNKIQKYLLPVLDYIYNTDEITRANKTNVEITKEFIEVIQTNLNFTSSVPVGKLGCLSALYVIKKFKMDNFANQLNQLNQKKSKTLKETLRWLEEKDE